MRPTIDAKALRMGTAHHAGLDTWRKTADADAAVEACRVAYGDCPEQFDAADWEIERETMAGLCSAYCWRWKDARHKVIASELSFRLPIINPETTARSTLWELGGKIDAIIELEDGRQAVEEDKTKSEDIAIGSDYYRRLQIDHQPTIYIHAARQLGYDVSTVIWDVTRKPTIKQTPVAVTDDLGAKIVLDATGKRVKTTKGEWRQTGSTADGYILQTRPMLPEEWTKKLADDIGTRPDFYFARLEIPRLDSEIAEMQKELWELQKTIREAENTDRWFRTVSTDTCPWCPFFGLCCSKWTRAAGKPEGFQLVSDKFPELAP